MDRHGSMSLATLCTTFSVPAIKLQEFDLATHKSLPCRAASAEAALASPFTAIRALRTVIVIGGGPAGLLAAAYLARRGCAVHLADKRPHPCQDSSCPDRAFVVGMNARGERALRAAGLDLAAFAAPGTGLQRMGGIAAGSGGSLRGPRIQLSSPRLVGPRHAFVAELARQLEEQQHTFSTPITFHWGDAFDGADLAAQQATLRRPDGSSLCLHYDLLVGADGAWSAVRQAAQKQHPEALQVHTEVGPARYKVFRGLAPHPDLPTARPDGTTTLWRLVPKGGSPSGAMFVREAPGGKEGEAATSLEGIMIMDAAAWEGLQNAQHYSCLVRKQYPGLPAAWADEIGRQFEQRPLYFAGSRILASQLHAPGVVLLGDAGHGVTPRTGNGLNAALEDAWLLDQLLESSDCELGSLPERFTAARLEDARALLWLDEAMGVRFGRGGGGALGALHPAALSTKVATLARMAGNRLLGDSWVSKPPIVQMGDTCVPYSQLRHTMLRDDAAVGLAVAAAAAATALLVLRQRG